MPISVRELAIGARMGDKTRKDALKRLIEAKFVSRDTTVKRRIEDRGTLVVLMDKVRNLSQAFPSTAGGLKAWDRLYTDNHPAFMFGKLGRAAGTLLITLLEADAPMTRLGLAKALGKKSRDIQAPLDRLLKHEVFNEIASDKTYQVVENWEEAIEKAAHDTGAYKALESYKERHRIERETFEIGLTRSRQQKKRGG